MRSRVGLLEPRVELQLEVEVVREAPAGLEVRLQISLQPLDDALGLRVGGFAEVPVEQQLPAEAGIGIGRAPAAGVQAALAIPDHQLRQRPERAQQRPIPHSTSGASLLKISAPAPARE